jgi:hypothetical protein
VKTRENAIKIASRQSVSLIATSIELYARQLLDGFGQVRCAEGFAKPRLATIFLSQTA